jgi:streptogramin lyase
MTGFARVHRLIVLALGALSAAFVAAPSAIAAPQVNGEFTVTGLGTDNQITQGPDGNIWVTVDDAAGNDVARINSQTGQATKFNLDDVDNPVGITRQGNNLWVTAINQVARFSPGSTDATATTIISIGSPAHITVGPDGNLWTVSTTGAIRISPTDPTTNSLFGVITAGKQVVAGGDGNLWATGGTQVARFTTAGAPAAGSPFNLSGNTQGIARGPGNQIGFGCPQCTPQSVGRITGAGPPQLTNTGTVDPAFGITFANDGGYWYSEFNQNRLARLTPQGTISHPLPKFSTAGTRGPRQITKGPNNTLWVTLDEPGADPNDKVARVTGVTPPTPPPPNGGCTDNTFEFGKAKKNKKKGTAKLPVTVPCAGDVELAKTKKVKADDETAEAEGDVTLLIRPKGKARKRLNKKGKAKVKAEVTYTPTGGEPNTQTKKIKLKRKRR